MATEDGVTEQCPSMKIQHLIQEQQCDVELSQLTKEVVSEQQIPKHAQTRCGRMLQNVSYLPNGW